MDCREARTLLAAYHDGELAPDDRARVEGHLRLCGECAALLARLAGVDANVDVPDPGPAYWERFNRRVMDRVRSEDAAPAKVVRPKHGWAKRQLPYFLPAVAAAALLLVVVRQTGLDPFSTAVPPAAMPPEVERITPSSAERAPSVAEERPAAESLRKREAPAAGIGPVPEPPSPVERGDGAQREWAATIGSVEDRGGRKAESAAAKSLEAALPAAAPSPCESARLLADQERFKEAEAAQRACLERHPSPELQESGLVFLAELLDRQTRFAEADAVIRETQRQFPGSRPLDAYLKQRAQVQSRPLPAAP